MTIDMERKGYELSVHNHDIDLCVTMVGWVDVQESDRAEWLIFMYNRFH